MILRTFKNEKSTITVSRFGAWLWLCGIFTGLQENTGAGETVCVQHVCCENGTRLASVIYRWISIQVTGERFGVVTLRLPNLRITHRPYRVVRVQPHLCSTPLPAGLVCQRGHLNQAAPRRFSQEFGGLTSRATFT